ncbi:hypothetical protein F5146DRAFT_22853 [Armillaria mellea]|nr:hypothetical protein F5146DRAFT_22853 [Armillaria mellea]
MEYLCVLCNPLIMQLCLGLEPHFPYGFSPWKSYSNPPENIANWRLQMGTTPREVHLFVLRTDDHFFGHATMTLPWKYPGLAMPVTCTGLGPLFKVRLDVRYSEILTTEYDLHQYRASVGGSFTTFPTVSGAPTTDIPRFSASVLAVFNLDAISGSPNVLFLDADSNRFRFVCFWWTALQLHWRKG